MGGEGRRSLEGLATFFAVKNSNGEVSFLMLRQTDEVAEGLPARVAAVWA